MEELIEKHGKGKVFGIIYAILAASLIIMVVLVSYSYYTVRYDGTRFRLREVSGDRVVLVDDSGNFMIMNLTSSSRRGGTGEITYLDKVISFSARRQSGTQLTGTFTFSDDSRLRAEVALLENHIIFLCDEPQETEEEQAEPSVVLRILQQARQTSIERTDLQIAEMRLIGNLLSYHQSDLTINLRVGITFLGLLFLLLGLAGVMYPTEMFRLRYILTVREVELSEFGLAVSKFGGIISIIMAFIFPLILFSIAT